MQNLIKSVKRKANHVIIHLIATGVILVFLAVLIVWTDFMLKLVIGLFVLVVAYTFFYLAFKLWHIKREIEKYCQW